MHYFSNLYW